MKFPLVTLKFHENKTKEIEDNFINVLEKERCFSLKLMATIFKLNHLLKDNKEYKNFIKEEANIATRHMIGLVTLKFMDNLEALPDSPFKDYIVKQFATLSEKKLDA